MAETAGLYPNPKTAFGMMVVEIDRGDIERYAPLVQGVLLESYQRRFETQEHSLPLGSIEDFFANPDDPKLVERQSDRMDQSIGLGSRYLAVHLVGVVPSLGEVVAIAKTTPSRPRTRLGFRARPRDANCFVNDLASKKAGLGAGSVALHASLTGYEEDREVILDAYGQPGDTTPENAWFRRLGFVTKGEIEAPVKIGAAQLQQFRMGGVTVGNVRQALVRRHPWLVESGR